MKIKIIFTLIFIFFGLIYINPSYPASDDFSKISKAVQTFNVEPFMGSGLASIPIVVPPGRRGIQPEIQVSYSSSSVNGWLGVGWTLNFGYIERVTKKGIPKYDSTDKFYISFMGINSELQTANNIPGEYYPKSSSLFIKLLLKGSYWEVYDKSGKKYIFGQSIDSRIDNPKGTFRWALNKIIDTCGNFMAISYLKDGLQIYPQRIDYAGNETVDQLPTHKVEFILEDRQDIISSFRSGYDILTTKRLKEIKTFVEASLTNHYVFEYLYSRQTGRSLLNKFICFGSDDLTSLPPVVFTYQDEKPANYNFSATDPFSGNKLWYIRKSYGWFGNGGKLYPNSGAFEGVGHVYWDHAELLRQNGSYWSIDSKGKLTVNLPEKTAFHSWTYIYAENAKTISIPAIGSGNFFYWLNGDYSVSCDPNQINLKSGSNLLEITGYNANAPCSFDLNLSLSDFVTRMHSNQFTLPQLSGDFNGDGLMDLATYFASSGKIKVSLSNGSSFKPAAYWPIIPYDGFPKYLDASNSLDLLLGDFDGNTKTDIVAYNGKGQTERITPSSSSSCFVDQGGGGSWNPDPGKPFAADFNGDGITDLGTQTKNNNIKLLFNPPQIWLYNFPGKILIGDFNGDGLIDIASYDEGQHKIAVALNKGDVFDNPENWITGFNPSSSPVSADSNGDGLSDIMYFDKTSGEIYVCLSDGQDFLPAVKFLGGFNIKDQDAILQVSDFNGDGQIDPIVFNPYTQKTEIAYSAVNFSDLLTKTDNGLGGGISIKYDSSSNYDNTITSAIRSEYEYRNLYGAGLPFPVALVKEVAINDGLGNSYIQSYFYKTGFYDTGDREFRGFGYVSVTDSEGNQKEVYFKQNDIFKGRPYLEQYKNREGKLFLKIEKTWYSQTMMTHPGRFDMGAGAFVYLGKESKSTYDGDDTYKTSFNSYSYSSDVSQQFITGDLITAVNGGNSTQTSGLLMSYTRRFDDNILSLPWQKLTEFGIGGYPFITMQAKRFYYDNNSDLNAQPTKGLLTKQKEWLIPNSFSETNTNNFAVTTYSYDNYGNLISTTDPLNNISTIKYDAAYNIYPIEQINSLGQIQKSTFDPKNGQILTSTDANNQTTSYIYDSLGRLSKVIGPYDTEENPGIIYEYDFSTSPIKITKLYKTAYPSTYAKEYSFYDGIGRLIETKIPAEDDPVTGQAQQIIKDIEGFNQQGKIKEKYKPYYAAFSDSFSPLDPSAGKAVFEYDCLGRTTKITNPDSTFKIFQYSDWVVTKIDENSHKLRTTFDALNQIIKQEEFNGSDIYVTQYNQNKIAWIPDISSYRKTLEIIDSRNNTTAIVYDGMDRKEKIIDPDMGTQRYTYDKNGNLISQKDNKNQIIVFTYDALNRLTKKLYPDGKSINYYYDDASKPYSKGRLDYVTDLSGRTDYYYDKLGRQLKTEKLIGGISYVFENTYNPDGQVSSIKYPDSEIVSYAYNDSGWVNKIEGASRYIRNINYMPSGRISRIDYSNGTRTEYTYDPQTDRLSDLITNDGALQNLHYQYDNSGNISQINDYRNTATQQFAYDDLNRLIQANGSYGGFSYQYDSIGNLIYKEGIGLTYGSSKPHAVTYGSDGFSASYDANGNMIGRSGAVLTYDYENRLVKFESSANPGSAAVMDIALSQGWNYICFPFTAANGVISSVLSSISGKYDQLVRFNPALNKFEYYISGQSNYTQFTTMETGKGYQIYVTDPAGCTLRITGNLPAANYNIALKKGWQMIGWPGNGSVKVNFGLMNLIKGVNYDRICRFDKSTGVFVDLSATDMLEAGKGYFIRLLKDSTWTIPASPNNVTEFVYDADGARVKKIVNGIATYYCGNLLEQTGSLITKHIYLGQNKVISKSGPQTLYYHPDHLGSSNVVTNSSGTQAQLSEYKPYGELSRNSANLTDYYFTGKELDSTGLYYFNARYFDPKIGRFISADPIDYSDEGIRAAGGKDLKTFLSNPQNLNHYSYCLSNPQNYTDPDGLYVILMHGDDENQGKGWFETMRNELMIRGLKQDVYFYSWGPSSNLNFAHQTDKFANDFVNFVNDLRKNYIKDEPVNIFAHSAGSVLLNKALKQGLHVDNVIIAGSPIISDFQYFITNTRQTHSFESSADVVNFWISGWWNDTKGVVFHGYNSVGHNDWVMPWNMKNYSTGQQILDNYYKILSYYPNQDFFKQK